MVGLNYQGVVVKNLVEEEVIDLVLVAMILMGVALKNLVVMEEENL